MPLSSLGTAAASDRHDERTFPEQYRRKLFKVQLLDGVFLGYVDNSPISVHSGFSLLLTSCIIAAEKIGPTFAAGRKASSRREPGMSEIWSERCLSASSADECICVPFSIKGRSVEKSYHSFPQHDAYACHSRLPGHCFRRGL